MVESTDDERALLGDFTPQTPKPKAPNFLSDPKFWPNVKPFVEGGLAGAMTSTLALMGVTSLHFAIYKLLPRNYLDFQNLKPERKAAFYKHFYPNKTMEDAEKEDIAKLKKFRSDNWKVLNYYLKRVPSLFVANTIRCTMLFGPYGFLTQKVEVANKGRPLSMYQEVSCAMISGAIGAWATTPLIMSYSSVFCTEKATTQASFMRVMYYKSQKEGILALWKGGHGIGSGLLAMNVGMLVSYSQIYNYLRQSANLTVDSSVLGAGLVSGFVCAAGYYPFLYVHNTMIRNLNEKDPFTGYLDCARRTLKSSGPLALYRGSTRHFVYQSINVMVLWFCLVTVKKTEESYGW